MPINKILRILTNTPKFEEKYMECVCASLLFSDRGIVGMDKEREQCCLLSLKSQKVPGFQAKLRQQSKTQKYRQHCWGSIHTSSLSLPHSSTPTSASWGHLLRNKLLPLIFLPQLCFCGNPTCEPLKRMKCTPK